MKTSSYRPIHLALFALVFTGISSLWLVLGTTVSHRSVEVANRLAKQVEGNWGPRLVQGHPVACIASTGKGPDSGTAGRPFLPDASEIHVTLDFKPLKKGLLTHRTYEASFEATYHWKNSTPVDQTLDIHFTMPGRSTRVDLFELNLDGKILTEAPVDGNGSATLHVPADGTKVMTLKYTARGKDEWRYLLGESGKARNFALTMTTNFTEFNVPADVESPTSRATDTTGMTHSWVFPNVTGVEAVGLEVPDFVNTARVAARMSFFGPLSLGLFWLVLVIAAIRMRIQLHIMHFVLLAAACFAFQLLFAYSVDVMPAALAFGLAGGVSLGLVASYLKRVAGTALMWLGLAAQTAYIIVFNATFFCEGYTGLTLTVMGIVTLALIMTGTAKMDWFAVLGRSGSGDGAAQ